MRPIKVIELEETITRSGWEERESLVKAPDNTQPETINLLIYIRDLIIFVV